MTSPNAQPDTAPVEGADTGEIKILNQGGAGQKFFGKGDQRPSAPKREFRKNVRRGGARETRVRPEFEQKIIDIRRVTRVAAGGKRFNFSVAMIAGNRNGSIGVGLGKGADTAIAINKAFSNAKRNMIILKLSPEKSLPHDIYAKYSSARVKIMPAKGRGVIAGSAARYVLELAGVRDTNAKLISPTKNQLNIARATLKALSFFSTGKIPQKIQ